MLLIRLISLIFYIANLVFMPLMIIVIFLGIRYLFNKTEKNKKLLKRCSIYFLISFFSRVVSYIIYVIILLEIFTQ